MEPSHHIWCFGTTVIDPIKQAAKLTSSRGPPNSPKWIILFHSMVAYSQLDITNFPTLYHEAKSVFRKKIDRFFFLSRNKQIGLQLTSKESCFLTVRKSCCTLHTSQTYSKRNMEWSDSKISAQPISVLNFQFHCSRGHATVTIKSVFKNTVKYIKTEWKYELILAQKI